MVKDDTSFGEYGDKVIDALAESVGHQAEYIPPKSNLKQYKDQQIPDKVLRKRISAEVQNYQITAGLTTTQRKILKAKIEAMRTRVYNDKNNYTKDAQIARSCKVSAAAITDFNNSGTCRNALMTCTKIYVENCMPDIIANLLNQGKNFPRPNVILMEYVQQYASRKMVENTSRNLNVNMDIGNSPDAVMKQVVIKFGSANYDRERFQAEIMSTWDTLKAEGAF
jgi:hypothetical protein